jgi:hypothetical protein
MTAPMTVWQIPRNDIAACHTFWRARELTGEEWRVMLRLQDDPHALITASASWRR